MNYYFTSVYSNHTPFTMIGSKGALQVQSRAVRLGEGGGPFCLCQLISEILKDLENHLKCAYVPLYWGKKQAAFWHIFE